MLLRRATEPSLMTPFWTDWRLLMGLHREHGEKCNSCQCRRLFCAFCLILKDPRGQGKYCIYLDTLPILCFAVMEVAHKRPDSSLYEAKEASSVGETRREKH